MTSFEHKNEELDQQRAALLKKATDDANAERQRLLDQARQAADALSAKRQEALRNDAKSLHQAIQRRTQHEVFAIARKALTDLATTGLEERLAAVFTRRLRELDGPTKAGLANGLKAASDSALVRSAFELPADQRAVIQNALNETFSADVHVRFETAPDLVSGIELATNGQKVGWTIAEYLGSLEKGVDELVEGEGEGRSESGGQAGSQARWRAEAQRQARAHVGNQIRAHVRNQVRAQARRRRAFARHEGRACARRQGDNAARREGRACVRSQRPDA